MRRLLVLLAVAAAPLLAGCGKESGGTGEMTLQPVTGKVVYDGKPAAGVQVTLIPLDAPGVPKIPRNPHAVTGTDGTFAIGTFAETDGAAEGGYQLVLSWPSSKATGESGEAKEHVEASDADQLLGWYDPVHSKVKVRVEDKPVAVPAINIAKVTAPPPVSQGVPGRN